ncbi:MAG: proteasome assembly chaperone family protein [Thermoplasmatales archaeon]|nr:MAG: proteasome assembly chaperone family protein [Thermoplasmatales archaeon]
MEDIELIEYNEVDLSNSLLVVAFPTVGLISSIAGHFIIDTLKLNEVGTIVSREFMPATIIHNSRPSPPVRIYAGEKTCGPDGKCEQIAVIISEFMPPYQIIKPLAEKIINWAANKGVKAIVSLEGTHAVGDKDKDMKVYGVASNTEMKSILKKYKIQETQEGMITGVNGVLLYEGVLMQKDVICLLSEAHSSYPDSRAAGNLLKKLDVMLPDIKIDPKPLYKEAEEIEKKIRAFMEQSKPTAPQLPPIPTQMYG